MMVDTVSPMTPIFMNAVPIIKDNIFYCLKKKILKHSNFRDENALINHIVASYVLNMYLTPIYYSIFRTGHEFIW